MSRSIGPLLASTALVGPLLYALGCSGGGGSATVATANNGGRILLVATTGSTLALGQFVKTSVPDTGFSLAYADGHCEPRVVTSSPPVTYADAGTALTFVGGGNSLLATRVTNQYFYFALTLLSGIGSPDSFTIEAAGGADIPKGTVGSIRVPALPSGVVKPAIAAGAPAVVRWDAGSGADGMVIVLQGAIRAEQCFVPDSGAFTVPPAVTGSAGTGAVVTLEAVDYDTLELEGRQMLLEGVTER